MGFIESLLGSGLANAITLQSIAGALKEASPNSGVYERKPDIPPRTGIQKELLERAGKAIKGKKYDVALPLLIRALKLDPNYLYYYSALGVCYHNLGKLDIALECYDKALDLAENELWTTDKYHKRGGVIPIHPSNEKEHRKNENYIKSVRSLSKKCEKELETGTNKSTEVAEKSSRANANSKSITESVRTSLKRDAKKSNNRGGNS